MAREEQPTHHPELVAELAVRVELAVRAYHCMCATLVAVEVIATVRAIVDRVAVLPVLRRVAAQVLTTRLRPAPEIQASLETRARVEPECREMRREMPVSYTVEEVLGQRPRRQRQEQAVMVALGMRPLTGALTCC